MSKRLQVVVDEQELAEIQQAARHARTTVSDWVRRTLREARCRSSDNLAGRLEVVARVAQHKFPVGPIDQMLAEIEQGYRAEVGD